MSLFSRLKRAVKYTRLRFSTRVLKRSFPGCELMLPPLPHNTSFSDGSLMPFSSGVTIAVLLDVDAASESIVAVGDMKFSCGGMLCSGAEVQNT